MRNTKCTCYEIYTWLNFRVFDLHENKVTAKISGYTVFDMLGECELYYRRHFRPFQPSFIKSKMSVHVPLKLWPLCTCFSIATAPILVIGRN